MATQDTEATRLLINAEALARRYQRMGRGFVLCPPGIGGRIALTYIALAALLQTPGPLRERDQQTIIDIVQRYDVRHAFLVIDLARPATNPGEVAYYTVLWTNAAVAA